MKFWDIVRAIWRFFKAVHSASEDGSAKRVYGGLIIVALLTALYLVLLEVVPLKIWAEVESTFQYIFTVGASLLGLNLSVDIFKAIKERKGNGEDKKPTPPEKP